MVRKKRIGIIMGRIYSRINHNLLSGILEQSAALGYSSFIFTLNEENSMEKTRNGEKNLFHALNFSQTDGIIYAPYSFDSIDFSQYIDRFLEENCSKPVVRIGMEEKSFVPVWFDDKAHISEITQHLIQVHGCRKLICLTGPENASVSHNRAEGFKHALSSAGLAFSDEDIVFGDFWINASRKLAEEISSGTREKPDGIVCTNDTMATSLCDALTELNIKVPDEILVTGYDGRPETAYHIPGVTTYQPSQEMLGRSAVCRLYSLISKNKITPVRNENGLLLCRESCGCCSPRESFSIYKSEQIIADEALLDCSVSASFYDAFSLIDLVNRMFAMRYVYMKNKESKTERLFLCLCDDWDSVTETDSGNTYRNKGYSEKMHLYGSDEDRITFSLDEILPVCLDREEITTDFFMPVHFQDQCFGYIVLEVQDDLDDFNINYIRYCREVNNALKFLCTQNTLKRLLYRQKLSDSRDDLTGLYLFSACKEKWTEIQDTAQLLKEQIYMIGVSAEGLKHIENAEGSIESDRCLAAFSDILVRCCSSREKIFKADSKNFVIIGSAFKPEQRTEEYIRQVKEKQWQDYLSAENKFMLPARTGVIVFPEETTRSADEAEKEINELLDRIQETSGNQFYEYIHYRKLTELRKEIFLNPSAEWNGDTCCRQLNISRSYFHKLYLRVFGVKFMQDLQKSRLYHARKLLLTTSMLLPDIAEACGYDYYNFMRAFKKDTGMTPTQYRKKQQ